MALIFLDTWPLTMLPKSFARTRAVEYDGSECTSPTITIRSTVTVQKGIPVPGIGEVPFTWVGEAGGMRIKKMLEEESLQPVVKQLQRDLKACSSTCLKALAILGADTSDDSDVKQAVSLCKQFTGTRTPASHPSKGNRICDLWRQEAHTDQTALIQTDERATELLGPTLVDVITQKHQKPPDVSHIPILCNVGKFPYTRLSCWMHSLKLHLKVCGFSVGIFLQSIHL